MNVQLIAIDPQESFVDPKGSLFVPGADADMDRLATLIGDISPKLSAIHVTLDNHHAVDISHPYWFASDNGDPAKPITIMSYNKDTDRFVGFCPIDNSTIEYRTRKPGLHRSTAAYITALSTGGRYAHTIWPEHCLIGTSGASVHPGVMDAMQTWARTKVANIHFVAKGANPFTEHFSAIRAEVPQPNDPSTQVNTGFISALESADILLLSGEALSHCVANTGRDIVKEFDPGAVQKIHLITDCSSNVPGFDALGTAFIDDMRKLGMKAVTAADVRAMLR